MPKPLFLTTIFSPFDPPDTRPHLTLTFAQSIDAKIAGKHAQQLILSGPQSMRMTHYMRAIHDAILVGIGTAQNDNPQLNTRHLPPEDQGHLPRPIILDSHLHLSPSCKLLLNYRAGQGRRPYIFTAHTHKNDPEYQARAATLENAGAKIFPVPASGGLLDFPAVLQSLRHLGIRSLMVEGGARVISSLFAQHSHLIDTIIVTVAPLFVGDDGVSYNAVSNNSRFNHVATEIMGKDTVIAWSAHVHT
ncbi:hypothetical protein AMATHDRAFT_140603 [Amanita thiersii Skay4041]|uniref:2,5-diamino-6-ribosylamino-4(3H)-pyrimidinone 5'-phosphate reductase n=1 Tax=Amanita thiersii Skay4041 TaxID=703135 RepID=A0A2A9NQ36_9AGAR|nr:hypothetical protein AMATHDRAFT_140603 [Amanita thiersii Skay4041]